jgi:hypothetical protein
VRGLLERACHCGHGRGDHLAEGSLCLRRNCLCVRHNPSPSAEERRAFLEAMNEARAERSQIGLCLGECCTGRPLGAPLECHEVLESFAAFCRSGASNAQCRIRYKRAALELHPDRFPPEQRPHQEALMRRLNHLWQEAECRR